MKALEGHRSKRNPTKATQWLSKQPVQTGNSKGPWRTHVLNSLRFVCAFMHVLLQTEPRAPHTLGRHASTKLYVEPFRVFFSFNLRSHYIRY